jgi:prolyl-tRNA editing enzyme YbaK/EbsC (Cys-tRNA(Pro) deacylase)
MSTDENRTIREFLDESGLDYEIMPCDPALADTAVFCERYGYPMDKSVNAILVKAKTGGVRYAACVLLATTRLDVNKVVRKRLEARRVSFATAEETAAMTGMEVGGVTPIGLPEDLPVWVDQRVMDADYVILGGGDRSSKIKISPKVFELVPRCSVIEGLAKLPPGEA